MEAMNPINPGTIWYKEPVGGVCVCVCVYGVRLADIYYQPCACLKLLYTCTCICVCMYVCMHACVEVQMYVCMPCMHLRTHTRTYMHTHIHTHTHKWQSLILFFGWQPVVALYVIFFGIFAPLPGGIFCETYKKKKHGRVRLAPRC